MRYVYIRSNSTYDIRNIPEGRYYLKIAYGKDWRQKIQDGKCIGKFFSHALYKKGENPLDFNRVYNGVTTRGEKRYSSYQIPSYSLSLDIIETDFQDRFGTNEITEDDFNDQE